MKRQQVIQIQGSLAWNKMLEFLSAINDSTFLVCVHLSDNGFVSQLEQAAYRALSVVDDFMASEQLPQYALATDVFDVFELTLKDIIIDTASIK